MFIINFIFSSLYKILAVALTILSIVSIVIFIKNLKSYITVFSNEDRQFYKRRLITCSICILLYIASIIVLFNL